MRRYPKHYEAGFHLLLAVAKNPDVSDSTLSFAYGGGDYRRACDRWGVVTVDGKRYIGNADLRDYILSNEPKRDANAVPPRQVDLLNRKPYKPAPIWSNRNGAMDYRNHKSLYA